ncbi:N(6)-adenosine-methyltransferase subunit METTL3-like [Ciona intestinalis]
MSSETWKIIQEHKRKQENLREILQKRRKKRQGVEPTSCESLGGEQGQGFLVENIESLATRGTEERLKEFLQKPHKFPMKSEIVMKEFQEENNEVSLENIEVILLKFAAEEMITVRKLSQDQNNYDGGTSNVEIMFLHNTKSEIEKEGKNKPTKRESSEINKTSDTKSKTNVRRKSSKKERTCEDIEELLATKSTKEETTTRVTDEIQQLLSTASTKEITLTEKFRSMGGSQVREFCPHATREECLKHNKSYNDCQKLHFRKILKAHTDETLGDCSFLNTCFHMDTCKYVHYEIDYRGTDLDPRRRLKKEVSLPKFNEDQDYLSRKMLPPQWINCDIRYLDVSVLGKFSVIMADPPWDIHMELPYGTMQDTEMRALRIQDLSDDGLMFLWVTGRAMELGRELFDCWGYKRCDELIWVKTNQLQRLIRTGRTGHWINHGKEHCLVGIKGNPIGINRRLDCDVLVAEVRDTSHKPDEIYGLIERLSPGTRKLELFGRVHNLQPNWVTLGNQLDGVHLAEYDVIDKFKKKYPDGKVSKCE